MNQRLLRPGGSIAVVAPSGAIDPLLLDGGVAALRGAGYRVDVLPGARGAATGVFAASDEARAADLAEALSRPDVDAVWCARGGYGAMRAIMALDARGGWRRVFSQTDKVIVGFSDITAIHSATVCCGGVGVLGPMLKHLAIRGVGSPDVIATLDALQGKPISIRCTPRQGSVSGRAAGRLIGGNLSILYSLMSTPLMPRPDGCLLFIEDLAEYRYHIDRMMRSLRFSGFLSRLAGVVVGQMTGMKDGATPFGRTAYEVVADAVADYGYPVLLGFPSGHDPKENYPVLLGAEGCLLVEGGEACLTMGF